jgi:hypothetical protein
MTSWTDFNDAPAQGWDTKPETVPTDDVRAALLDRLDQVLAHLLPAGRVRRACSRLATSMEPRVTASKLS